MTGEKRHYLWNVNLNVAVADSNSGKSATQTYQEKRKWWPEKTNKIVAK